jgi:cytoskeletal protein CcmA (bactofilin family)
LVIAAAKAVIKSEVKGDLFILGGEVTIDNSAKIDGDVFIYSGNVLIKGQISGDLKAGGSKVQIDQSIIKGDATIQSEQISLSDNSQISGKLTYYSKSEMSLKSDLVQGGIAYKAIKASSEKTIYNLISSIVMLVAFALIIMWIGRERVDTAIANLNKQFGQTWLTGFLVAILTPLLILALMVTYAGIYAAAFVLVLYVLAWLIAYAYSAIILGSFVVKVLAKSEIVKTDWAVIVFGSVLLVLIGMLPLIGGIIAFLLIIAGLGMFFNQLKGVRAK